MIVYLSLRPVGHFLVLGKEQDGHGQEDYRDKTLDSNEYVACIFSDLCAVATIDNVYGRETGCDSCRNERGCGRKE